MGFRIGFNTISSVLTLVAFVFLLLVTLSTPVTNVFNLSKTDDFTYGIFGYCAVGGSCSKATYPYTPSTVDDSTSNWQMSSSARDKLAKIFVVAPIALGFNFIALILLIVSHISTKVLVLVAVVANVIAFLLTALVTIIVILVFYPNMAWTGWILVGASAASLLSLIGILLKLAIDTDTGRDDVSEISLSEFAEKDSGVTGFTSSFGKVPPVPANQYTGSNFDSSSSISKGFESKASGPQSYNPYTRLGPTGPANVANGQRFQYGAPPQQQQAGTRSLSNSSIYHSNPQLANDFTKRDYYDPPSNKVTPTDERSNLPYPPTNPRDSDAYPKNHPGVFEHHLEVEGHKPFTELEDFDDDHKISPQQNQDVLNDSDAESDFTSVSQRAPNPQYNPQAAYFSQQQAPPPPPQQQQQYSNVQQFQPLYQQQQFQSPQQGPQSGYNGLQPQSFGYNQHQQSPAPQRPRTTTSDNALANNPDFGLGVAPIKRKVAPGFVPVANRINNKPNAASLMGRNGRSGPYGAV